jgi:hypothetical protein
VDLRRSKTVIVGFDSTPGGLEAVTWAAAEARLRGQRLRIVHASTTHDPRRLDQAYRTLDDAVGWARDVDPHLDVRVDLEADDPVSLLEREARMASVLVLGPPGRGGVTRHIVDAAGHPTSDLVAPIVVVPGAAAVAAAAPVAVLVETSAGGTLVTAAAIAAAARSDRHLRAIRVPPPGEAFADSLATLDQLVARAGGAYPNVDIETEVQRGRPLSVLAEVSSEAGLIVVSGLAFGGGRIGGRHRSVRRSLLGWARCPVMVVPVRLPNGTADPRSQRTAV